MSLTECMQRHTYRQYLVWVAWLDRQWDQPQLTDLYLMQIAAEVRRGQVKKPNDVKLTDLQLRFKPRDRAKKDDSTTSRQGPSKLTKEQATAMSQAYWFGTMTMPVKGI